MGRKRTGPTCAWSSGSKRRQICNDLEEQMDMRAVLGEDAVDTKRNRLTTARAKQLVAQLVHSHKNSNAIGEFETKGQSENLQLRDIILNEHTFSDSDK